MHAHIHIRTPSYTKDRYHYCEDLNTTLGGPNVFIVVPTKLELGMLSVSIWHSPLKVDFRVCSSFSKKSPISNVQNDDNDEVGSYTFVSQ